MNNNGVSLLRYLRDEGADVYLFPFFNDGKGSLKHFSPESEIFKSDTVFRYIKDTQVCNWPHQLLPSPFGQIYLFIYSVLKKFRKKSILLSYARRSDIRKLFQKFDLIITSGYGPAILSKAGLSNYIFFPYCIGIEGIAREFAPRWARLIARISFECARPTQINALRIAKKVYIIDYLSMENAKKYNIKYKFMLIPLVYSVVSSPEESFVAKQIVDKLTKNSDIKIFAFSRIIYTEKSIKNYSDFSKNNDWILSSLRKVIDRSIKKPKLKLVMVEYGPDIEEFKSAISQYGLTDYFSWTSIKSKREILSMIPHFDVCFGELISDTKTVFGSTGWEIMACGKPVVNSFNFELYEFEKFFGIPEMPFIKVKTKEDLELFFESLIAGELDLDSIGRSAKQWFETHFSRHLARKWVDELRQL